MSLPNEENDKSSSSDAQVFPRLHSKQHPFVPFAFGFLRFLFFFFFLCFVFLIYH